MSKERDDFTAWYVIVGAIFMIILLIGYVNQAIDLARIRVDNGFCHGVLKARGWDEDKVNQPVKGAKDE